MPTPNNTSIFKKLQNNRGEIAAASAGIACLYSLVYISLCWASVTSASINKHSKDSAFCTSSTANAANNVSLVIAAIFALYSFLEKNGCITTSARNNQDDDAQQALLHSAKTDPNAQQIEEGTSGQRPYQAKTETETETEEGRATTPPPTTR